MRERLLKPSREAVSRLPVASRPQVLVSKVPFPGAQWSLVQDSGDAEIVQAALTGHSLGAEQSAKHSAHVVSLYPQVPSIGTIITPFHRDTD